MKAGPYTVTASGLSAVTVAGREVCAGRWELRDFAPALDDGATDGAGRVTARRINVSDKRRATVLHTHERAAVAYTYAVQGDDLHVTAAVTATGPDPVRMPAFGDLAWRFDRPPGGLMSGTHWNGHYLRSQVVTSLTDPLAPMWWLRVRASWAADGRYGVGLCPRGLGTAKALLYWHPTYTEDYRERGLTYVVGESVPPGATRTFRLTLRVSRSQDWRELLAPYREEFGAPNYTAADPRPILQFSSFAPAWVRPDNPCGYNDVYDPTTDTVHYPARRLDQPWGVMAYESQIVTPARDWCQGVLHWNFGGWSKRGVNYPIDSHVHPPEVEGHLPEVAAAHDRNGVWLGHLLRPGEWSRRLSWDTDGGAGITSLTGDVKDMLRGRIDRLRGFGVAAYYLDSFGLLGVDGEIMAWLRSELGPDVPTFAEFPSDWLLADSGFYVLRLNDDWFALGQHQMDVLRWLCPQSCFFVHNTADPDWPGFVRRTLADGLVPLIHDFQAADPQVREAAGRVRPG